MATGIRQVVGAVIILLFGVVLEPTLGVWIALVVAVLLWVILSGAVLRRLPRLALERAEGRVSIHVRAPEVAWRRRRSQPRHDGVSVKGHKSSEELPVPVRRERVAAADSEAHTTKLAEQVAANQDKQAADGLRAQLLTLRKEGEGLAADIGSPHLILRFGGGEQAVRDWEARVIHALDSAHRDDLARRFEAPIQRELSDILMSVAGNQGALRRRVETRVARLTTIIRGLQ